MEIRTSRDFVRFMSEAMEKVRSGDLSASAGNAVANLGGKILQVIALEMKVMQRPRLAERRVLRIEADAGKSQAGTSGSLAAPAPTAPARRRRKHVTR